MLCLLAAHAYACGSICICIRGGLNTLKQILDELQHDCPVLLVRESGGAAELLAELIEPFLANPPSEKELKERLSAKSATETASKKTGPEST